MSIDSKALVLAALVAASSLSCKQRGMHGRGDHIGTSDVAGIAQGAEVTIAVDEGTYPFHASEVRVDAPSATTEGGSRIEGAVMSADATAGTLVLLGLNIVVDSSTELVGFESLADVQTGTTVRVDGDLGADGAFHATSLRSWTPAIRGAVSAVQSDETGMKIQVLGKTVVIDDQTSIVVGAPQQQCGHADHGGDGEWDD